MKSLKDLIFIEVPPGKLKKPRGYQHDNISIAFLEKIKYIKKKADKINAKL